MSNQIKAEEKLTQSLKLLGVEPSIASFAERKRMQKITYLLEQFGVNLGFDFDWYLHGPYSTTLTRVLYKKDPQDLDRLVPNKSDDIKKIENLKKFLGSDIKSSNTLELIVSLHYLMTLGKSVKKSDEEILKLFLKLKPFFSEDESRYYLKRIKETFNL